MDMIFLGVLIEVKGENGFLGFSVSNLLKINELERNHDLVLTKHPFPLIFNELESYSSFFTL